MTHPLVLHAQAAVWSLHRARAYLGEHRVTVLIARPQLGPVSTRPRSLAQLAAYDELLRAERPDRGVLAGAALASGPAPVAPGLLDLEREMLEVLVDVHQLLAVVHRRHPRWRFTALWIREWGPWAGRLLYVDQALADAAPAVAGEVRALVEPVDQRARAMAGRGPDHWRLPLSPPCPGCDARLLRVQTACPDTSRWTVVCGAGCLCAGEECGCGMPVRAAGVGHIWTADGPLVAAALAGVNLAA